MKKIDKPFGCLGYLNIGAVYAVGDSAFGFRMDGSGNADASQRAEWESFDSVSISVAVEYDLLNPVGMAKGSGKFGFKARWKVLFSDDGIELVRDGVQPKMLGSSKSDGMIVVAAHADLAESRSGSKKPFIEMVIAIGAGLESEGVQVGLEAGPLSVGTSLGGSKASSQSEITLRLGLLVDQPQRQTVPKIPSSMLEPAPVLFEDEDQDTLSRQSTRELHDWASKIKDQVPQLGAVIALGELPIQIQAFASTTGSKGYNKKETDQRADAVKRVLKSAQYFNSSKIDFDTKSHGKAQAEGKGAKYGFNRRVEIKLDGTRATKAIQRLIDGK